jgi:hypothetical protein
MPRLDIRNVCSMFKRHLRAGLLPNNIDNSQRRRTHIVEEVRLVSLTERSDLDLHPALPRKDSLAGS